MKEEREEHRASGDDPWADAPPAGGGWRANGGSSWPLRIAFTAGGIALATAIGLGAYTLMSDAGKPAKKQVVQISLLAPPPPPPPPPPPEVKPPEPEIEPEKVEIPEPQPEQQAEESPPQSEDLGIDAEGSGSGDDFGLVGKKGGQDITTIGGGPSGNRSQFGWFTGQVQSQLQDYLRQDDRLRRADYRVVMRLWFGDDGRIERYELVNGSGNAEVDRNLKLAMDQLPRLRQPPPGDLPQPMKLRITSRGAG